MDKKSYKSLGIYVHIPFCERKCAYCDFYSIPMNTDDELYTNALIEQIKRAKKKGKGRKVNTIYFGGGTPSIMSAENIEKILKEIRHTFTVSSHAEITIEINPGTVNASKLAAYRDMGINRLSIGLQSANDDELKMLSRIHNFRDFDNVYSIARMEGFKNISVDIMYALPNQTLENLMNTMKTVIGMKPESISFYGLKIEPGTPFGINPNIETMLPDEDTQIEMYTKCAELMENNGYMQYEISNFARVGYESKHNMKYWDCKDYLGFGPAAYSFFNGEMYSYVRDVKKFLRATDDEELYDEKPYKLTPNEIATQFVMLGFRTTKGIVTEEYQKRFNRSFWNDYSRKMAPFISKGYILQVGENFRLSRKGMLISNYILSEILDFKK